MDHRNDRIEAVAALEILDSRGNPTLAVRVRLADGSEAVAQVPSGASTGSHEAVELRDGDPARYGGRGVTRARRHVEEVCAPALLGRSAADQAGIDRLLVELDGTPNKSRLGANAVLGVSLAVLQAAAVSHRLPLYRAVGGAAAGPLPVPFLNVLNGGVHADNGLDIQEFMLVPGGASSFAEALRMAAETFHALGALLKERGLRTAVGDEGGYAPDLPDHRTALELLTAAIERAGYRPGEDIALALDVAASELAEAGGYRLEGSRRSADDLTAWYRELLDRYPIVSIEDGLGEDDWAGWQRLTRTLGDRVQLVGDDLFVTNPERIARGIREGAANAVLIKPNQIGTVSETVAAVRRTLARGWHAMLSHRSGETADTAIADLAVGLGTGQIKAGAPSRGERVAKYNRLLWIEAEDPALGYAGWEAVR